MRPSRADLDRLHEAGAGGKPKRDFQEPTPKIGHTIYGNGRARRPRRRMTTPPPTSAVHHAAGDHADEQPRLHPDPDGHPDQRLLPLRTGDQNTQSPTPTRHHDRRVRRGAGSRRRTRNGNNERPDDARTRGRRQGRDRTRPAASRVPRLPRPDRDVRQDVAHDERARPRRGRQPRARPVRPTDEDPVAAAGSELIGGPGRPARPCPAVTAGGTRCGSWSWSPSGCSPSAWRRRCPATTGGWFFPAPPQYIHACYSDIPHLYHARGFADRPGAVLRPHPRRALRRHRLPGVPGAHRSVHGGRLLADPARRRHAAPRADLLAGQLRRC